METAVILPPTIVRSPDRLVNLCFTDLEKAYDHVLRDILCVGCSDKMKKTTWSL